MAKTGQSPSSAARELRRMDRELHRKVRRGARKAGDRGVHRQKREIVELDAVASTDLFRGAHSWTSTIPAAPDDDGDRHRVTLVNTADHAGFVEWGTGQKGRRIGRGYREMFGVQHFDAPSLSPGLKDALTRWASIKPSLAAQDARNVGERVARVISGNVDGVPSGTAPQPFFVKAQRETEAVFREASKQAVRDVF